MSAPTGQQPPLPAVADAPRSPRCSQLWTRSDRRWDRIRHTLIVGWLVVIIATPVAGEWVASWGDVRTLVATGQVETVRVSGELGPRATGYSVVEVQWRHGLLRYTAEVVQVQGRSRRPRAAAATDGAPVIHATPSSRLEALRPGLQVTWDQRRTDGGRLLGWQVPNPLAMSAAGLFLAGFGLLLAGPLPWRAAGAGHSPRTGTPASMKPRVRCVLAVELDTRMCPQPGKMCTRPSWTPAAVARNSSSG